jgi:hypothetical protein
MTLMVGLAVVLTAVCLKLGALLPPVGQVLNAFSWAIVLLTTVALLLSLTPLARLESAGASTVGYAGFYLLLASVGAQGDLRQVVAQPQFILLGVIVIVVHALVLLAALRLMRAPLFFLGAASQGLRGRVFLSAAGSRHLSPRDGAGGPAAGGAGQRAGHIHRPGRGAAVAVGRALSRLREGRRLHGAGRGQPVVHGRAGQARRQPLPRVRDAGHPQHDRAADADRAAGGDARLPALRTRQRWGHAMRSVCGLVAFVSSAALRHLPLADAVAIAFGSPFLVTALASVLLKEHVGGGRWAAIGAGFLGMLVIVRPRAQGFHGAAWLVLLSAWPMR